MFRSLYGKLVAVLLGLGIIMAAMFVVVIHSADHARRQEVSQKFYRTLAGRLISEDFLLRTDPVDYRSVQRAFDRLRIVNPKIDVYLLDQNGRILAYSGKSGVPARATVNMEPIRHFLDETAELPILGDDPGDSSGTRIFSVAPIALDGRLQGYLYLVLRGLDLDNSFAQQFRSSSVLRESMLLAGGGLLLVLLASTLIIKFITH